MIIVEKDMGPYQLVYVENMGPYRETGQVLEQVKQAVKAAGIEPEVAFGSFLDDPKAVKPNPRSEVGVIVKDADLPRLKRLKDLKQKVFPKQACVTLTFPFKNMISIHMGVFKAYPALGKYCQQKGYQPAVGMEIYESKTITYLCPINK
jgi:effector-binding domain-containing protein